MYHLLLSFQVCEFHRYLPADKWMLCAVPGTKYFGNNQHFATYHARRNQVSWKHFHCYWSYVAGSELASLNWWWCGKGSQWDSFYGCPKILATASSQSPLHQPRSFQCLTTLCVGSKLEYEVGISSGNLTLIWSTLWYATLRIAVLLIALKGLVFKFQVLGRSWFTI